LLSGPLDEKRYGPHDPSAETLHDPTDHHHPGSVRSKRHIVHARRMISMIDDWRTVAPHFDGGLKQIKLRTSLHIRY
jgi:hypothetical protein